MKPAERLRKPDRTSRWPLRLAVVIGAALPVALVLFARARNGSYGFPLDDTWISLTYARTLAATGRFSYFPGGPLSSGATSPLHTMLLAAGFLVTANEKLLALGLSLLAYAAFLVTFARWAERRLGSAAWAAAAVLMVALDGRIAMVAASGMETSLFLLLVALAFHEWSAGRRHLAALAVAATIWTRPDGFVLAAVFALDLL